jgi:hypothetical protein
MNPSRKLLGVVTNIERVIDESVKHIESITRHVEISVFKNDIEDMKYEI